MNDELLLHTATVTRIGRIDAKLNRVTRSRRVDMGHCQGGTLVHAQHGTGSGERGHTKPTVSNFDVIRSSVVFLVDERHVFLFLFDDAARPFLASWHTQKHGRVRVVNSFAYFVFVVG